MGTGPDVRRTPGQRPSRAAAALRRQRVAAHVETLVHDLRNPLAVIQGYAQLLCGRLGEDDEHRDLEALLAEVTHLADVLTDLEHYVAVGPEQVQVVELDQVVRLAQRGCVPLRVELGQQPPRVLGHVGLLAQALSAGREALRFPGDAAPVLGVVPSPAGRVRLVLVDGALPGAWEPDASVAPPPSEELRLCAELLAGYGARLVCADGRLLLDLPAA